MKCKMDCNKIIREGKFLIRPALETDAMPYLLKFNGNIKLAQKLLPRVRAEIKEAKESLINESYMILYEDTIIGGIECKATDESGCKAYVEIYIIQEEDKGKYEEVEELFIKLLKENYVYDTIYILAKESWDLRKAREVNIS